MKIIELFDSFNINYQSEGHKHCRPGWINTECPFCTGNPGLHLGYSLESDYFKCWRCGFQSTIKTIAKLLKTDNHEAYKIIKQYEGTNRNVITVHKPKIKPRIKSFKFPSNVIPLTDYHKQYLRERGFDNRIEYKWNIISTGPVSLLDGAYYNNRILAPIHWEGKLVSFQTRTISERVNPKYKACPLDRELTPHQSILYGKQSEWRKTGICVEGIFDVWRFGVQAFAVFGIDFTHAQIKVMSETFERIAVVFDDDPQAKEQADKLVAELRLRGIDALRVDIIGDPASMNQKDADYLVRHLL